MGDAESLTLGTLKTLGNANPNLLGFVDRLLVSLEGTEEEFLQVLYDDFDSIANEFQKHRHLRCHDEEDRTTIEIISNLNSRQYNVTHDEASSGHADMVVRHGRFTWIGEAKRDHSSTNILEGFKQLVTRYTTGTNGQKSGGLLIYIQNNPNASLYMEKWKKFFMEKAKEFPLEVSGGEVRIEECSSNELAFFTVHEHQVSGNLFRTRHMPILLHFNPQDKSGLKRKP